ncbi:type IV CRISPR-associated protein Csf1 [Geopseudomonas aromaticivorans]
MLHSSELIAQALKLTPDAGLPTWQDAATHCSHCACPINPGDLFSPVALGAFFSDSRDLAAPNGIVCWRCVHLRKKTLLNGLSFTVITRDAVYPIAQNIHKAWLFLTPPEGPFVALHSSSTMQHLAWRTPVTLDNRRISIRFGPNLFVVRPDRMRKAMGIALQVTERAGGKWLSPLLLDRKAAAGYHGLINPKAEALLEAGERDFLVNLAAGERWALSATMNAKQPLPERPDPITETLIAKL